MFIGSFPYLSLPFEESSLSFFEDSFPNSSSVSVISSLSGDIKPPPGQYIGIDKISSYSILQSLGINVSFSQ